MSPLLLAVALSVSQVPDLRWPEPTADFDYQPLTPQRGLITVWANDRRGTAWEHARGGDLWLGQLSVDGGTRPGPSYGNLLCHGLVGETISSARVAAGPGGAMVAWKVSWDGGQEIRASHVSWESGAPRLDSCDAGVVAASTTGLSSLQLEFSRGDFLVTWEDAQSVQGRFVNTTAPPFIIARKAAGDATLSPSLAAVDVGFFVAWQDGTQFMGARVPAFLAGGPVTLTADRRYFPEELLAGPPIVSGSPVGAAWPTQNSSSGELLLRAGAPQFLALTEVAIDAAAPMAAGPMATVTTNSGAFTTERTWVAHKAPDAGTVVTYFGANATGAAVPSVPLTRPGYLPQAMLMVGAQARLLTENQETLSVTAVPDLSGNASLGLPHYDRLTPAMNWVAPSATWVGSGWLVVSNQGGEVFAKGINTLSQESAFEVSRPDAGLVRVLPVADETSWVATFSGSAGSGVVDVVNTRPRLYARGNYPAAVSGRVQSLMWAPGTNLSAYDSNATTFATLGPAYTGVFGRCGAWAGGRLLVPIVYNGNELKIASLADAEGANLELRGPLATLDGLTSPCLVADGDRILITATNPDGGLLLYETTASDLDASRPATEVALGTRTPGGFTVIDPVAAPTAKGWLVAWFTMTDRGAFIIRMNYDRGAPPYGLVPATQGPDDREPQLVRSSEGHVLLLYRRFEPTTGNVVVGTKVVTQPLRVDAGVSTEDAGVEPSDGGVDAGQPAADAGVDDVPMTFRTCSCDAGPTLLAVLGVVLLGRRRRSGR